MDEYFSTRLNDKFIELQRAYKACEILEMTRDIKESMCYMSEVPISDNDPRLHNLHKAQFEVFTIISFHLLHVFIDRLTYRFRYYPLCSCIPPDYSYQMAP